MTQTAQLPTQAMNLQDLQEVLQQYNQVTQRLEVSHERLQAEVARLTEQLEEKNRELEMKKRLAALGEMAAGIAHEIRNPLGGIQLYASTLAAEVADRPAALTLVHKISNGVKGLNALVSDMLSFTQNIHLNRRDENLAELVAAAVDLATPVLQENQVDVRIADNLESLTINVDAKMIRQVLLNLLLNAAEAIGEGREKIGQKSDQKAAAEGERDVITITARPAGRGKVNGPAGKPLMTITITDTGPGIPPDVIERIFNPFFTTKHKGTGLGLAIVHRIIEAHGGRITAENRPKGGAVFKMTM